MKIENPDASVMIYRVEQIYAMDGSSSEGELLAAEQVNGNGNGGNGND